MVSIAQQAERTENTTMFRFNRFFAPATVSALLLSSSLSAKADIQYTMQTSIAQEGAFKPISTATTFLKEGLERTDSVTQINTFRAEEHTVSSRSKREKLSIDPNLKIYVSEPLSLNGGMGGIIQMNADGMNSKPGTGKMVLTVGAQFLGNVKMLGLAARHYKTSTDMVSTGCCGAGHTNLKTETWMADITLPTLLVASANSDWKSAFSQGKSNCKITFERKGDVAKYDAAQKDLALKSLTFDEQGNAVAAMEITNLLQAPLPVSTFQAPSGFKKVTRTE